MIIIRYFKSEACVNCQEVEAGWREFVSANRGKAEFIDIDVLQGDIAEQFNIEGTPSWTIHQDGIEIYRKLGVNFSGLQNALNQALRVDPADDLEPVTNPSEEPPVTNTGANAGKTNYGLYGLGLLALGLFLSR